MKKLSLLLLVLLIAACDEGVVITVPVTSSISAVLPASVINAQADNLFEASEEVDISSLVNEESESIETIALDKLVYELSGYDNTSGNAVSIDLTIQTRIGTTITDILVLTDLLVGNTGVVVAYEEGVTGSLLSAAQVASLEAIMGNLTPFDFIVKADFTGNVDSDLTVGLTYDISISVATGD